MTVSKMGPLERIDAAMESYVERKSMEEGVDWSTFATLAAMELPFKDDEESSEVINLLLSMGDSATQKGTAEQEGELRAILVRAMARCSTKSRKAELAQACEAVVGEEVESRRVAENFLVKRAGATTGVLALERGSTVKVRVPDARPAVCIRFSISEGVSSAEIEEFATLLVDTEVHVNSKHMRRGRN